MDKMLTAFLLIFKMGLFCVFLVCHRVFHPVTAVPGFCNWLRLGLFF